MKRITLHVIWTCFEHWRGLPCKSCVNHSANWRDLCSGRWRLFDRLLYRPWARLTARITYDEEEAP